MKDMERLGHIAIVGAVVGFAVLWVGPKFIVQYDTNTISEGEFVKSKTAKPAGIVQSIEGMNAVVRDSSGVDHTVPVAMLIDSDDNPASYSSQ